MITPGRAAGILLIVALGATGCDEKLSEVTGPTPNLQPTFSSIQRDILQASDSSGRAACTNCHTTQGRTPAGGLNLVGDAAYAQLVNVPSRGRPDLLRVSPGNPDASYLIHKLEGAPDIAGARMPLRGPFLTAGQVLVIRRWIALGAANN